MSVALLSACVLLFPWSGAAELSIPPMSSPVVDQAELFSKNYQRQLGDQLQQLYQAGGPQIAVLTLPTLQNETIEGFSIRVVDAWKLGRKDKDDGLLILIAKQERRARFEVGKGLEGDLPDAIAKRILNQELLPAFKVGAFEKGLSQSLARILERIAPNQVRSNLPATSRTKEPEPSFSPAQQKVALGIFWALMLLLFLVNPQLFLLVLLSGGRGGGRLGGGRGGWSGGGGGFGGGGASGGW